MQLKTPAELLAQLIEAGFAEGAKSFLGCTEEEISCLEEDFQLRLPEAYKEFLRAFGKQSGFFLDDCSYLYQTLKDIKKEAENMANQLSFNLEPTWFVFLVRDDIFLYFDTQQAQDPPVWRFDEGTEKIELVFPSYSAWLNNIVQGDVAGMRRCYALERELEERNHNDQEDITDLVDGN